MSDQQQMPSRAMQRLRFNFCKGVGALYSLAMRNTTELIRNLPAKLSDLSKSRPGHFTQWEVSSISPNECTSDKWEPANKTQGKRSTEP